MPRGVAYAKGSSFLCPLPPVSVHASLGVRMPGVPPPFGVRMLAWCAYPNYMLGGWYVYAYAYYVYIYIHNILYILY